MLDKNLFCDIINMNNKRKVLTMIEFDERQVTPRFETDKLLPKNVYLLREPFDSVIKNQNFRFAVLDKDKKNAFFLHDKRVFSLEEVKKVLPRQEMFVCEFLVKNNGFTTVISSPISSFTFFAISIAIGTKIPTANNATFDPSHITLFWL